MENREHRYCERITIEGMQYPVNFTFFMEQGVFMNQYKVRTIIPGSEFYINFNTANKNFMFPENMPLPDWLCKDKNAQKKLSDVVMRVINSYQPKNPDFIKNSFLPPETRLHQHV